MVVLEADQGVDATFAHIHADVVNLWCALRPRARERRDEVLEANKNRGYWAVLTLLCSHKVEDAPLRLGVRRERWQRPLAVGV